jgi:AcrR family transcriptional regulator
MTSPPPRGTRPANRRALIRDAGAELFARHGYANVAVADIAAAVNMGPSAFYRHYAGKAELLYDVVDAAFDDTLARLPSANGAGLAGLVHVLAANALDNRLSGVLWQREARALDAADRARLRRKIQQANRWFASELRGARPELSADQAELLAGCALAVLTSVSFHRVTLPRAQFEELLAELTLRVLRLDPAADDDPPPASRRARCAGRPDRLIDAAVALFARHGYAAVSIDDIGAAVGIAGPSVYNHFPSKHDILIAAMQRGHQRLHADLIAATNGAPDPTDALSRVTDSYVDLALEHSDLVATLIGESVHLASGPRGREIHAAQRAYIDDWIALMLARNPADSPTVARIKVQAAQMVANDVGRTPGLRRLPGLRATVRAACWVLQA